MSKPTTTLMRETIAILADQFERLLTEEDRNCEHECRACIVALLGMTREVQSLEEQASWWRNSREPNASKPIAPDCDGE